ncbi:MAG: outer membrane lipoprotein carrier protein LolA [Spirochaetales bacterium]|nr:outer membrane lipoprotein carrier protein LolA [Spirochaetales bacterium]
MKRLTILIFLFFPIISVFSQDMQTASDFLAQVEAKYTQINDMKCNVTMRVDGTNMTGSMIFKRPNFLKMEFKSPANQVISLDGSKLQIYIPSQNVVMVQNIGAADSSSSSGAFSLIRRSYAVAFLPDVKDSYVRLDSDNASSPLVKKLKFTWKQRGSTSIREMIFSINKENFIVRVDAVTDQNKSIVFNFSNFKTNMGLKNSDFAYDAPPSSYQMNNFLSE